MKNVFQPEMYFYINIQQYLQKAFEFWHMFFSICSVDMAISKYRKFGYNKKIYNKSIN